MALPKVVVTRRSDLPKDTTADTPPGMSNLRVVVMPAVMRVLVRVVRTYLQCWLGLLGASPTGVFDPVAAALPLPDAAAKVAVTAGLAVFPAFVALLQNAYEVLSRFDERQPQLRA